ncbi:MAG: hypothetical protein KDE01_03610, partial [Caldilineaceae bacterium]|nr:hypothetical protein [Caldilineaceae bacterium]
MWRNSANPEENEHAMKAMLYLSGKEEPVAVFDEVTIVTMNDNHKVSPARISYKSKQLSSGKAMVELYRHEKMRLQLEDGQEAEVLLTHSSLDMEGNAVGVLRV